MRERESRKEGEGGREVENHSTDRNHAISVHIMVEYHSIFLHLEFHIYTEPERIQSGKHSNHLGNILWIYICSLFPEWFPQEKLSFEFLNVLYLSGLPTPWENIQLHPHPGRIFNYYWRSECLPSCVDDKVTHSYGEGRRRKEVSDGSMQWE